MAHTFSIEYSPHLGNSTTYCGSALYYWISQWWKNSPYIGNLLELWSSFLAYQRSPCIPSALFIYLKSTSAGYENIRLRASNGTNAIQPFTRIHYDKQIIRIRSFPQCNLKEEVHHCGTTMFNDQATTSKMQTAEIYWNILITPKYFLRERKCSCSESRNQMDSEISTARVKDGKYWMSTFSFLLSFQLKLAQIIQRKPME